jgi:glutamine amidotransferase-like uncharacterized protein
MKIKLAVFLNHPECSVQCVHGIIRALNNEYDIECFNSNQIRDRYFKRFDVIAFPGGIGDSDSFYKIISEKQDVIKNQISKGKAYLGICMGAYWAGKHYFDIVENIDVVQYIKRPYSEIRRSYSTVATVTWLKQPETMFFYDGCTFLSNRSNYHNLAQYQNGDPAAIIQNNIGLIGPHPESDIYWYDKKVLAPHWHNYHHHKLLLDFVNQLVK